MRFGACRCQPRSLILSRCRRFRLATLPPDFINEIPDQARKTALTVVERELAHGQDYLLGSELSIADFFLLPSTFAFSLTEDGKAMYPKYPAFCRWRERMENLPATRKLRAILPPREPIPHAREWAKSHRPKY